MKNPYDQLGVPKNADERRLREVCQALLRRHEGDARRMREISDAYEAILVSRGGGKEAFALLESVPEEQRGGEWHYRMGCAQRARGWLETAEKHFARAAQLEPENRKYRAALKRAQGDHEGKSAKSVIFGDDTCTECCCECICSSGC